MEENQNWKDNFKSALKTIEDLNFFPELDQENLLPVVEKYSLFLPKALAEEINLKGLDSPLAKQFLPSVLETHPNNQNFGLYDPIGDQNFLKAPQLIHRYSSRALFTPTSKCPVHCRYCFRKNEINNNDELFDQNFEKTLEYLKTHSEISEIIFTGGDPFTLGNDKIKFYLEAFSKIKSIKDIRFHTRYPVIMPERFDDHLIEIIQKFSYAFRTFSMAIHCNHIEEFNEKNKKIIRELSKLPIQLLSQSVLLKGVNDSEDALIELINEFLNLKIRPYYLHHPDQVKGGLHFYLPLEEGRRIYAKLRGHLPGWAIPTYIYDIPGGEGKTNAYNPEGFAYSGKLINLQSEEIRVSEPDQFSFLN